MKQNFNKGETIKNENNVWNIQVRIMAPNLINKRFYDELFSKWKLKIILN